MYIRQNKTKRRVRVNPCMPLLICIALTIVTGSSALAGDAVIGYIPYVMPPGTEVIYDDLSNLPDYENDGHKSPYYTDIPKEVSSELRDYLEMEEEIVDDNFERRVPLNYYLAVIYPKMKVVYDEETGNINNIYFFSPELGEYVLHNDAYNEELEAKIQNKNEEIKEPKSTKEVEIIVSDVNVSTTQQGARGQLLSEGDCLLGSDRHYRKQSEHDLAVRNLVFGNSRIYYYEYGKTYKKGISFSTEEDAGKITVVDNLSYSTKLRVMFLK